MTPRRPGLRILPLAAMSAAALASGQVVSAPRSTGALRACASIDAPAERLACYDRLAGRVTAPQSAPPAPTGPATASAARAAAPAAAPAAPPAPDASFGLYAAEHPAPPKPAAELALKVVALGANADGDPTVTLEGGQLWQLDDPDPLLAVGDRVTIHRAAFGSFLMFTPTNRRHRVRRLR